ncbi:MAG: class I SAM-dependent methyltransferase [Candidatus Scalindua sp.]|nr:class I SAM-dependent methyltransferase [Candidatus Scalindua sp.]
MNTSQLKIRKFENFVKRISEESYPEPTSSIHTAITEKMIESLIIHYSLPDKGRILDVGCGHGSALKLFHEKGFRAVGITINREDFLACREKGFEVHQMDQTFIEFSDEEFDFVWCRHCLEHSFSPYLTLLELSRVLKQKGYMYIEVPAPDTVSNHQANRNHYSVLGKSMWTELIKRSGFDLLDSSIITIDLKIGQDVYWSFVIQKP